jgi:hypothetical protein
MGRWNTFHGDVAWLLPPRLPDVPSGACLFSNGEMVSIPAGLTPIDNNGMRYDAAGHQYRPLGWQGVGGNLYYSSGLNQLINPKYGTYRGFMHDRNRMCYSQRFGGSTQPQLIVSMVLQAGVKVRGRQAWLMTVSVPPFWVRTGPISHEEGRFYPQYD